MFFVPYGCTPEYSAELDKIVAKITAPALHSSREDGTAAAVAAAAAQLEEDNRVRTETIQRLAWNLSVNAAILMATHRPEELVALSDEQLAVNSPIESEQRRAHVQFQDFQALTTHDYLAAAGFDSTRTSLRCKNPDCRHAGLAVEFRVTRSGDEGMTPFIECPKCERRWKM